MIPRLLPRFRALALTLLAAAAVAALHANPATEPVPRDAEWVKRHEGFVEIAHHDSVNVLFLGDSITDFWRRDPSEKSLLGGRSVWNKYFAPLGAENFGISADRTEHLLWRIENGELDQIHPKAIVLMIGTNNTGKNKDDSFNTTQDIVEGITAVVQEIRRRLPDTKILLLAVFPRALKGSPLRQEVAEINLEIAKLDDAKLIHYLDIGQKFLEPDGTLSKGIFPDLLHPNAKGYEIWAQAIKGPLNELLK